MAFFMTKKQKAQMRERRRKNPKLKKEGQDDSVSDDIPGKRKLDSISADQGQQSASASKEDLVKSGPQVVVVPSNLNGKDAKKFRKDARRKARSEGRDENLITFVTEGKENDKKGDDDDDKEPPAKKQKANKKSFPRINDLLLEQKKLEKEKQQEEVRQQADAKLPDEVKARYVGLDCEMVGIGSDGKQSALARVSITDWFGNVVMDTFVKVPSRVTDFRTFVSGVTAKHLHSDEAMELHACRKKVAEILKGKILVGHSLKNDLQALLLDHPKTDIRDTAKYRPFQRASGRNGGKWRPRKLRDLVKEFLNKDIQVQGEAHDSTEDANATMELFKHVREAWEKELNKTARKKK